MMARRRFTEHAHVLLLVERGERVVSVAPVGLVHLEGAHIEDERVRAEADQEPVRIVGEDHAVEDGEGDEAEDDDGGDADVPLDAVVVVDVAHAERCVEYDDHLDPCEP